MKRNGSEILLAWSEKICVFSLCLAAKKTSKKCEMKRSEANKQGETKINRKNL
jgi:hypothetical protein